ncbi:MAG: prepilin-type N-terminal cleavage/methylation domain-containing protein [Candidatus Sumerlaeaceae bacterium]|nr:prepilin-type N-terminal cleavage/methylation domain-containing protein [Candidatus Sumerlaeaceae bacterium]
MIAPRRQPARRGFTLIELLVVVGIIAILAAIAVPSLLTAQTRSKVSRVKADLRTLAAAIEMYSTDAGLPPLDYNVSRGDPQWPEMTPVTSGILHPGYADASAPNGVKLGLTTPVAYTSNCWIDDPFVKGANPTQVPFDEQKYTYNWFAPNPLRGVEVREEYVFEEYEKFYGNWRLGSVGPDRQFYNGGGLYTASKVYDPTNGTVSIGNIWRSQREPDVRQRPPGDEIIDP